jgi:SAM-dependent methyltransferase
MVVSKDVRVDTFVKDVTIYQNPLSLVQHLKTPYWEKYMDERVSEIFMTGGKIIDIGGGLRIDKSRCDREDPGRIKRFGHFLEDENVDYKVTDYTDEYHPDFVEDIHNLSFESDSIDGLFCIATLEHVYDPIKATSEIVRVLKPGGKAFVYAPYIYRYHAHRRDYRDYYRFSKDGWGYMFRDCSNVEVCPVRGLFESLIRFTPLHLVPGMSRFGRLLDSSCGKMRSISEVQTSGYNVFITK